jgi:NADPH:quinone reductase-like Zn-dependent oxidoreductase
MTMIDAWIAKNARSRLVREQVELGPLGAEEVEVAVEHCGLCHSDVSVLNNEWGISQFPAVLGHEVIGRVTSVGSGAKEARQNNLSNYCLRQDGVIPLAVELVLLDREPLHLLVSNLTADRVATLVQLRPY